MRNRIEHDFQRPDIKDLEALFDLVSAFVAILQTPMTPGFEDHMDFSLHFQAPEERQGNFSIADNGKAKKFVAEWWLDTDPPQEGKLEASFANPEDFAYFFRVLLLLNQFYSFASYEHIRARLKA